MKAHAGHCAELLDALGTDAHVVGHSSSALIAVDLVAARPELVRSLVLVEPPLGGGLLAPEEAELVRPMIEVALQPAMLSPPSTRS